MFTAEPVFISIGYLYAAPACKFRVHFPWVQSNIVSIVLPKNWIINIDCTNYFVHREMDLKKRIAHFTNSECFHKKVCGSVFWINFLMNKIIIYIVNPIITSLWNASCLIRKLWRTLFLYPLYDCHIDALNTWRISINIFMYPHVHL